MSLKTLESVYIFYEVVVRLAILSVLENERVRQAFDHHRITIIEMVASYQEMAQSSLKLSLKRLRFWYNNRLLTTYGCREAIFVSGSGPGVRTVTRR